MRGPAGTVGHVRVARTLAGDPRSVLDELLVHAIVKACHQLCGVPYTSEDQLRWSDRLHAFDQDKQVNTEGCGQLP
jgi:hypothetical protein